MTDVRPVDADNHYDEPLDAFTRHLDPKFTRRGVGRVRDDQQHVQLLIGERVNRFVLKELSEFSEPEVRKIMRDNCLELLGPAR